MFFVSLSPLRLTKYLSLLATCIGLNSISCDAQPIFLTVASTPYDQQMNRISRALSSANGRWAGQTSVMLINQWMYNLRSMPYRFSRKWRTPGEVAVAQAGDCKGKAVLLYAMMRSKGARNLRLVIGKHHADDLKTHAWLEWDTQIGTYVLDPTFNFTMAEQVRDEWTYIPFYAYDGSHKYRATNAALVSRTDSFAAPASSQGPRLSSRRHY